MHLVVIAIIAVAAVVGLVVVFAYNGLVTLRNRVTNAFAQIDVQLRRRHDLIPNLVETVKGYMAHERQTLEAVTAARNAAVAAGGSPNIAQVAAAESSLTAALSRLRLVSEAYPDLKANQSAALLMEELGSTENRIAFARQAYNDAVMAYNTRRETLPTNIVAGAMGFAPATLFEITDARERENVRVQLA